MDVRLSWPKVTGLIPDDLPARRLSRLDNFNFGIRPVGTHAAHVNFIQAWTDIRPPEKLMIKSDKTTQIGYNYGVVEEGWEIQLGLAHRNLKFVRVPVPWLLHSRCGVISERFIVYYIII